MHEPPVGVIVLIPSLLTPAQTEQQRTGRLRPPTPRLDSPAPLNQSSDEAVAAAAATAAHPGIDGAAKGGGVREVGYVNHLAGL